MRNLPVLIVDDDPGIVQALGRVVTTLGFVPLRATSIQEALELIATRSPDIAIMDYHLGTEGRGDILIDAWFHIENSGPICIVSGYFDDATEDSLLQRGVWNTLQKPINYALLQTVLLRYQRHINYRVEIEALSTAIMEIRKHVAQLNKERTCNDKATRKWRFIVIGVLVAISIISGYDNEIVKLILSFL